MDDRALIAAIQAEESTAYGDQTNELASEREDALKRYLGEPYGNELPGRSQVVSSDVADTIEWMMPELVEVFLSGDEVVRFDPKGPEDEEQAQQETDYINHVAMELNPAFVELSAAFKDALMLKNGYWKAFPKTQGDVLIETYENQSQEELDFLLADPEVEVIGQVQHPDPMAPPPDPMMLQQAMQTGQPPPMPPMVTTVRVRRKNPRTFVGYAAVPPEEIRVSAKARSVCIQDVPFIQHRPKKTLSELRQMGYIVPDDITDATDHDADDNSISQARNVYDEDSLEDQRVDPSMREVTFRESWIRYDYDGDGIAELRQVCMVGNTILETKDGPANYECEMIPIACVSPILMPHRHIGRSMYDLIKDLALIKTTLTRGFLDNLYLQQNGRHGVDKNNTNIEDMLVSRPGGIVRFDGPPMQSYMPLAGPDMSVPTLQGIEYIDTVKENRTGVTKYNQGLDANSLNKTASGINQVMSASQQRIKMIARCFAETGVRDLFRIIHHLTLKVSTKAEKAKLRNKWIVVNPREWVDRYNLSINVGLGNGNKDQMVQRLYAILQAQMQGVPQGLSSLPKIRYTLGKITQYSGFKNPESFFDDPPPTPPQPPPPESVQVAQINAQTAEKVTGMQSQVKHQTDLAIAQLKSQTDVQLKEMENANRVLIEGMKEETKRHQQMLRPVPQQ